jgi:hypothetical protein
MSAGIEGQFVACGSCRATWQNWEAFVTDSGVMLLGLQAVLHLPDANLLVFEHRCGSSVSVLTSRLRDLLPPDPHPDWPSLRGTPECAGHCLSLADLLECTRECRNARDRDLIKVVQRIQLERASPAERA